MCPVAVPAEPTSTVSPSNTPLLFFKNAATTDCG